MSHVEAIFWQLLKAASEQADVLDRVLREQGIERARPLAACLRKTINRLERVATLCLVAVNGDWEPPPRKEIAVDLDGLRARVAPLLDEVGPLAGEVEVGRFGTRLSASDPLAPLREGTGGFLDLSGRVLTGMSSVNFVLHNVAGGQLFDAARAESVISAVDLRCATLEMARLPMAQLLDIDAREANLDGVAAMDARLLRANLAGASLRAANLQAALVRDCDLSGADLTNARWHRGTAARSLFPGATLIDLSADHALFLQCDFRGADFAVGELGNRVTMVGARFMNCDLRWSHWDHRTLAGASFVGCKFYGVLGVPYVADVIIEDADLSAGADLSCVGSRDEVIALWNQSTPSRRRANTARLGDVPS